MGTCTHRTALLVQYGDVYTQDGTFGAVWGRVHTGRHFWCSMGTCTHRTALLVQYGDVYTQDGTFGAVWGRVHTGRHF